MASTDRYVLTRLYAFLFLKIIVLAVTTSSFHLKHVGRIGFGRQSPLTIKGNHQPLLSLHMVGFGDNRSAGGTTGKLKAKSQWDRYLAMKQSPDYTVGVKVAQQSDQQADGTNNENWLVVGKIRCQDESKIEQATARQRALLAEHAKRLFPMQISPQAKLAWGYQNIDDETWNIVDPKAADAISENAFDKTIGFQGSPDPGTGFYCVYNEGRLVDSSGTIDRPSSKKLADTLPSSKKNSRIASKKLGS